MIKLNKSKVSDHQIFCIELSRVPIIGQFLEFFCVPENKAGKKADNYWIINTQVSLNAEENYEQNYFNHFMHQVRARGYNSLMILNK